LSFTGPKLPVEIKKTSAEGQWSHAQYQTEKLANDTRMVESAITVCKT
jgi:hypothetical protein